MNDIRFLKIDLTEVKDEFNYLIHEELSTDEIDRISNKKEKILEYMIIEMLDKDFIVEIIRDESHEKLDDLNISKDSYRKIYDKIIVLLYRNLISELIKSHGYVFYKFEHIDESVSDVYLYNAHVV